MPNNIISYQTNFAYDSLRNEGVLYSTGVNIWKLNDIDWVSVFDSSKPSAENGSGFVYDAQHDRFILLDLFNTWQMDPEGRWAHLPISSSHDRYYYSAMVYDPVRDHVVVFGGQNIYLNYSSKTWELQWGGQAGDEWKELTPLNSPPPRSLHQMIYDDARARVVLFGGYANGMAYQDTWEFQGDP